MDIYISRLDHTSRPDPSARGERRRTRTPRTPTGPARAAAAQRRIIRAAHLVLATALLVFAGWIVFGTPDPATGRSVFFDTVLYNALILGAAALCLSRGLLRRHERLAWLLVGTGILAWGLGDLYWTIAFGDLDEAPFPSVAEVGYLASYPLMLTGLAALLHSRLHRFRTVYWLDAAIAAIAIGAIGTALLVDPILDGAGGGVPAIATTLGYPIGDLLLLGFVAAAIVLTGFRLDRSWGLILAGLAASASADAIYGYQDAVAAYVEGTTLDLLWPLGAILIAFAAWQPATGTDAARPRGWRAAAAPAAVAIAMAALLGYGSFMQLPATANLLAVLALAGVALRMALIHRENRHLLDEVQRDPLTGLGNRVKLNLDLDDHLGGHRYGTPATLALFDLDGFKLYNDTFGHPAGDALLRRLASRLAATVGGRGQTYRIGGDEFCVLVPEDDSGVGIADGTGPLLAAAGRALEDRGRGFLVTASHGKATIPAEATTRKAALQLADQRMYAHKGSSRVSARSQVEDVLMEVLRERAPELAEHGGEVRRLVLAVSRRHGLEGEGLDLVGRAADLHDIGKIAIPDAILSKPAPLDEEEWLFIRDHTVVGGRIISAAPALKPAARLVRHSHEHIDGNGYPDGLAGEAIPLGSRIIFACDALHAMVSDRPYSRAMSVEAAIEELRRCAGSQFDAVVVESLVAELEAGTPVHPHRRAPATDPRAPEPAFDASASR